MALLTQQNQLEMSSDMEIIRLEIDHISINNTISRYGSIFYLFTYLDSFTTYMGLY